MTSYTGTTALVTGASKGIGASYAQQLASRGADLVLVARSASVLEALASQLRSAHNVRVEVVAADLLDRGAPQAVADTLTKRGIEVDLLINNAGMSAVGPFLTRPLGPNVDSVDLNITTLMGLVHSIGVGMLERGRGGIINISSVAGFQPMPFQASYGATKAFVLSFTEALAEELRDTDLRVMAVHPGPVKTGFFDGTTAGMNPKAVTPERIAAKSLDDFTR
ncbi:SDR family NAD(P)-dependent oxidoreductase [Streptomyces dioscori]|uniref:SDR family NAD(P)-dependent oxidoreductase n=1 Tax=Streptomyces dioscori TaxID=2109333 RepID=UPI001CED1478|nr:SDR family oxidoreductase [Streptomyces dioscori]